MKESFKNRAIENLEAAELLFENGKYNASANRAYYAAFHSAIAALYSKRIKPNIDHRSVQSLFNDMFINKRKIIPAEFKRYLSDLQNVRNIADYKNGVSKKISKEQIEKSKNFIDVILKVII
ncbi:MAG TPA: HEPN domain-containing protein [Candidatus Kapabacteria bacterium]|nr:HEPN domain-containing protein [Candidatus Kapabacteria bacterium]